MNYLEMIEWHRRLGADSHDRHAADSAAEAERFGITDIDEHYGIRGFEEKPQHGNPIRSVFNPEMVSASMGIYIFDREVLHEA